MRAEFNVIDVLRVQVQEEWPDLPNQILNPSGEGGAWGWRHSYAGSLSSVPGADSKLRFRVEIDLTSSGTVVQALYDVPIAKVTATGLKVRALVDVDYINGDPSPGAWHVLFNVPGEALLGDVAFPDPLAVGLNELPPTDIPVGTENISLYYVTPAGPALHHEVRFKDAWLIYGPSADVAASDPLSEPPWVDVTGQSNEIQIDREDLNVGELTATIYDSTLDPASSDLIRPGKRCRAQTLVDGVWEDLFNGLLDNPSTAYLVSDPKLSDLKRVRIGLKATDGIGTLANAPRPHGVGTIDELPAVLLGTGVPFNVNGSDAAIDPSSVVVVAVNDQAKAIDQIAITRDSVLGYAWLDRHGVMQAWDRDLMPSTVLADIDEAVYNPDGTEADFDVERCFNTLTINVTRINTGTGETEEVAYGPYTDPASVRQWRTRTAEFRVQGIDEDLVDELAADILERNATPSRRINALTIPLRTAEAHVAHALRDLYDLVSLSNTLANIDAQQSRITSITHRIKADRSGGRWWVDLGFASDGSVATPQVTPSPTVGGGVVTMSQLLRPVGEVTMFYGPKADIPAGWLPLDGSTFDGDQYPALAELLGGTVLPDMEDRFPIGAGSKALGSTGGAAETQPPSASGVGWAVQNTGGSSSPRLSEYNAHTHSLTPPYRALWFIVRAA